MPSGFVIDNILIDGLRGFNNAQTIKLDGTHAIIKGKMGTGKSSTLCAIEWALFGDISHIKCSESKTQAEFVNSNKIDQKARVILKLKSNDGEYIIQREKHAKKRDSDLIFSTPAGEFEGDEAANQIYSIFGTFDDFHRSVFLHQDAIRAILTENPEERDSALDRLFGLERTRELMSAIPITLVKNEYKELDDKKIKIEERIKGATQQAEVEMGRAKKEAFELRLKPEDFNLQICIKKFKEISNKISSAAEDCGVDKPLFTEPSNEADVSKGLNKIKGVLKTCRMQIIATSKYDELRGNFDQTKVAKKKLEEALSELNDTTTAYDKMVREWGSIEQIEKQEKDSNTREEILKNARANVDSTFRLVADGIGVLSEQEPGNCPICDTKISPKEVLSKLQTKISNTLKEKISSIDNQRNEIREKLLQLADFKKKISKAFEDVEKAKKIKDDAEIGLRELLQSISKECKNLLKEADGKLSEMEKELIKAKKALDEKNIILQGIDDSTDICRAIVRVLEKEAEYDKIKETFAEEGSQIEILKNQITEMSALHARLQRISEAIATVQINLAREFIGKGEKEISNYYSTLCGHPYYNSIRIDIDQRNVRGVQKNTYNIKAFNNKDGKETLISTRFSMGQMNSAALSIFLSLSAMLNRNIEFMILDDPSQNLDIEHKKFLIKVLGEVALKNQLIVATQDTELEEEIETGFIPKGGYVVLKYEGWSKDGPEIKASKR